MRKIVAGLFTTLDGVIEELNEWLCPWFYAQVGQAVGSMIAVQDAILPGRVRRPLATPLACLTAGHILN